MAFMNPAHHRFFLRAVPNGASHFETVVWMGTDETEFSFERSRRWALRALDELDYDLVHLRFGNPYAGGESFDSSESELRRVFRYLPDGYLHEG